MLSLPSTWTYQNNSDCCVSNETVTNPLANRFSRKIVINVSISNRFVHNIFTHHFE